ncbi:MAG: hypothetical protein K0S41_1431 [Anaerocolumna sp.]|jgi:hypothetical protein|nr:hypothetical protein [Anaerocolumna sp.]
MKELKMTYQKGNWNHINTILTFFLSFIVVILSVLGLFNFLPLKITNSIVIPILGIITFMNGLKLYKKNKKLGIISVLCGLAIFECCIFVFLYKIGVF